jgi:glutaredoxin
METLMIEVLTASGCSRCQKMKTLVKDIIAEFNDDRIQYREINVVEHLDYAVQLGVMSTPALAFNGILVFPSLPSNVKLRQAIQFKLEES